jgi:small subunit ribosomal protein S3Ae
MVIDLAVRRKRRWRVSYFEVYAPSLFEEKYLGTIIGREAPKLIGRIIEVPMYSLTENPLHQFIKCKLKIVHVEESGAYTTYFGHEYFREYVRSLFNKSSSYVECIRDLDTSEGRLYRLPAGVFTTRRINTSRKKAIRRVVFETIERWSRRDDKSFIRDSIFGVIDSHIINSVRKIYPVRWAGIIKVKVVGSKKQDNPDGKDGSLYN